MTTFVCFGQQSTTRNTTYSIPPPCPQVWDVLGGGRLLHSLSNHQKTVTCLCLDGTGSRLLSGGLDRHVKIYNLQNFKVIIFFFSHHVRLSLYSSPGDHEDMINLLRFINSIVYSRCSVCILLFFITLDYCSLMSRWL